MTTLFAQSYGDASVGFYFEDYSEYCKGIDRLNYKGYEEFDIQFIDGESGQASLFKAASISQASVQVWFEYLDDLGKYEIFQLTFLLNCGYELEVALQRYSEVHLHFGSACNYAQDIIEETSDIPEHLTNYIDYDAIARDMEINGDITQVTHHTYVTNAREF
ncbi:hypothetical protein D210916BOD24_10900 [Alteromonas sp. D210916BOD_24]|uniref:antirestriction protein ArdA n=1 Tax=Alteromonas sp. D210916BOD_24 TaxID=3157618 RepID=UPI00399C7A7E